MECRNREFDRQSGQQPAVPHDPVLFPWIRSRVGAFRPVDPGECRQGTGHLSDAGDRLQGRCRRQRAWARGFACRDARNRGGPQFRFALCRFRPSARGDRNAAPGRRSGRRYSTPVRLDIHRHLRHSHRVPERPRRRLRRLSRRGGGRHGDARDHLRPVAGRAPYGQRKRWAKPRAKPAQRPVGARDFPEW